MTESINELEAREMFLRLQFEDPQQSPPRSKVETFSKWAMIPVILAPLYFVAMHVEVDPSGNEIRSALSTITDTVPRDVVQLTASKAWTYDLRFSSVTVNPPVSTGGDRFTYRLDVVAGDAPACKAALETMMPLVTDFTIAGKVYETVSSISYRVQEGRFSRTYNPGTDRCDGQSYPVTLGFEPTVSAL